MKAQAELQKLRSCFGEIAALSTPSADAIGIEQTVVKIADAIAAGLDADITYLAFPLGGEAELHEIARCSADITDLTPYLTAIRTYLRAPSTADDATSPAFLIESLGTRLVCRVVHAGKQAKLAVGSRKPDFPSDAQHILLDVAASQLAFGLERHSAARNAERLATLVEHSSDFIGIADLEGRPTYINPAGMTLVGLESLDQLASLQIFDFVPAGDRPRVRDEILREMMRRGRWTGELQFRHFETNAVIPVLLDGFLIEDPANGVPINIATVTRDLTAQKRTEAQLRSLNEQLEQRIAERTGELEEAQRELILASRLSAAGQMVAALAHELNQPLTAMTNSVNSARRLITLDGSASPVLVKIMEEATEEALRASRIIRRLRDFVDRGETDRRLENLPSLIEDASALALAGSGTSGVEVRVHTSQDTVQVLADRIQIQQVLVTLIRNALAAMHDRERRELEIRAALLDNETVEITVADTGRGWPADAHDHLFDPFISSSQEGMGLGLLICRSIIERHGGSIQSWSNPDGGTTVGFTLTAVPEAGSPRDG